MTICISCLAENYNSAIFISDKMISVGEPYNIEYEPENAKKIESITDNCFVLTAGSALSGTELFRKLKEHIKKLKNPSIEIVVDTLNKEYQNSRLSKAEEFFLKPRGLDLKTYYQMMKIFPIELVGSIDKSIMEFNYDLSIIVCGLDDNSKHRIFLIENPGIYESFDHIGFVATGIGDTHAISTFTYHRYDASFSFEKALLIAYLAKKNAERAPGVGKETHITIIKNGKIKEIPKEKIIKLDNIYDNRENINEEKIKEILLDGLL